LCAQDRQIDELEAKIRELQAKYDAALVLIMERDAKINDLNALLDSSDAAWTEHKKQASKTQALLQQAEVVAKYWREIAIELRSNTESDGAE
jgi:chromosome segregation ATPase